MIQTHLTKLAEQAFFKILLRSVIGVDAEVDHTQIIGGDTVNLLGDISPPGFATPGSGERAISLCPR